MSSDPLAIALIYPKLLGLYGDRGNAIALRYRASARGIATRLIEVDAGDSIPASADIYLVGGAEDRSMEVAADLLAGQPGLAQGIEAGASCLAVCAGFQLLSGEYVGPDDQPRSGLGILDVTCGRLSGERAVGEVVARSASGGAPLLGFENHQGDARLGPGAQPLGFVEVGQGNGHDGLEGARQGRVIGTYLHGPALVRNPELADELIENAVGPLEPFDDDRVERLRHERHRAAFGLRKRLLRRG